jgi:predicted N-acyltransferase
MTKAVSAQIAGSVGAVLPEEWDACAGSDNPFVSHVFLSTLEESGSATARTGWQPIPVIIDGADGAPSAIAPAYAKSHSQGEYVFDHAWAAIIIPSCRSPRPFRPSPGPGCCFAIALPPRR